MRRCKRLRRLRKTFFRRVDRLERRIMAVASFASHNDRDVITAYVTIEALNAWALFSRSFYLSCAMGALTERKKYITATQNNDPLGTAIMCINNKARPKTSGVWSRRDEPTWHDPNVLMKVCQNLGCSNHQEVTSAFSLGQKAFTNLPVFRNFFAHRNEQTSTAVRNIAPQYMLPTYLAPTDLLMSVGPGATQSVILESLTEIKITAEFLCKS